MSGASASAVAALLEWGARKVEGTWARIEFTHRITASSAFVSATKLISQCFHPPLPLRIESSTRLPHKAAGKTNSQMFLRQESRRVYTC